MLINLRKDELNLANENNKQFNVISASTEINNRITVELQWDSKDKRLEQRI